MQRVRAVVVTLGSVAVILILFNLFYPEPKEWDIRIVTPPAIIASLPHWVAVEREFYSKAGLRIQTVNITASNLMVQALIEESADVLPAVSLVDVINGGVNTPSRPQIFSHSRFPVEPPFEAIVVAWESQISSLHDLEGKYIAVYPGVTSKEAVKAYLSDNGVDISEINFVLLPPPAHLQMLQRGDISASHIYDPYRTSFIINRQARMISGSVYCYLNPESSIGVSAISMKFLEESPEAARKFLQVWDRSVDFIREHERDAREILQQRLGLLADVAEKAAWVNVTKVGEMSQEKVIETAVTFQRLGVIDSNVVVDNSYFYQGHEQH